MNNTIENRETYRETYLKGTKGYLEGGGLRDDLRGCLCRSISDSTVVMLEGSAKGDRIFVLPPSIFVPPSKKHNRNNANSEVPQETSQHTLIPKTPI